MRIEQLTGEVRYGKLGTYARRWMPHDHLVQWGRF
jgi:hypothetical protein